MNNIQVSIIIPCYNQGKYLLDAIQSLTSLDKNTVEVIIINDGSTEPVTLDILKDLQTRGFHIIHQENKGLGEARNTGIREAGGRFILPLDADNKITPDYITKGLTIMDVDPEVAVVYGNAQYFGDRNDILVPGLFNLQKLMLGNFIDACAMIRRDVIIEVGMYDNMKIMGLEDWDLWLRIAFRGYKFSFINEVLFFYRVSGSSMMNTVNQNIAAQNELEKYFQVKYGDKLDFDFVENMLLYRVKKKPFNFFYRLFLKKFFPTYFKRQIDTNKIYRGNLYGRS